MIENYRSQTIVKSELMSNSNFSRICTFKTNLIIECGLITDNELGSEVECLKEIKRFIDAKITDLKAM